MRLRNPNEIKIFNPNVTAIICIIAANGIFAESTCVKGCPKSDNGLLRYLPGNVYEYKFESIMTVGLNVGDIGGTDSDDTNLRVVGSAELFSEGNCGFTLQLHNVKVTAIKEQIQKSIAQGISKPVHFTMASGKVQSEICIDASDTAYALNVKRAIISLLHSSTEEEDEVDVFGQCATHTSVLRVGDTEIIRKVRNLSTCSHREQICGGILSGVANDKSGIKSTMMLKADYIKEAKLKHGLIENVHLVEEYGFNGATNNGPIVNAKVVTSINLLNSGAGDPPKTGNIHSSIMFQKPVSYDVNNIAALKIAFNKAVELVTNYVKMDAGKQFMELLRLMRQANTDTLLELASFPHPDKVLARKVYLDALFRAGTAESVKAIFNQINKMDEQEKIIAMLSINFVQAIDMETFNQAFILLGGNMPKEAYLAMGYIVSKFCQSFSCGSIEIEGISKKFTDALNHCKANTKKDEERIVYVLKGIRNTHHIANSVTPALIECASTGKSNRIRVAALQAFSAASCDSLIQHKAVELLHDRNEDSEVRIEAYLAAIECPTAELSNRIAEIINNEPVNQVGGFMASSLKTIRDSTDDKRASQRYFLGNIRITRNFPKDYRRYSFDNEISYSLNALGLSASSGYQLIYSQNGFLPRSGKLNITTELFGTNFNIFELNVRQENIENILEYYMGPKGLLNKNFDEILGLLREEGGNAGHRSRRSIADESAKFAKRYETYGSKINKELNLDISLKLFGTEMLFMSLGDNVPNSLEDVINHFSTLIDKVKNGLSSFNKEFRLHSLFIDTQVLYPTGVGFPLELSAQGFSANKFEMAIEFDVDTLLQQNWQSEIYRFKFVPSVDVNMNIRLGFNAYVVNTGLRVVSSVHSATGSDIHLQLIQDGKNGFNIDIELPREKMELINLQLNTNFFIAEQDKNERTIGLKSIKNEKQELLRDCFNKFEVFGCSICFVSNVPQFDTALYQIGVEPEVLSFMRPFIFSVYITSERIFNLKGYHIPETENGAQHWKLVYNTPGSKVAHDTSLSFEMGSKPSLHARISLDYPQHQFAFEAGLLNDRKELVLYGQYEIDNEIKTNKIGFLKIGNEYHPVIEVHDKNGVSNEINGFRAYGKVVIQNTSENKARYNFDNFQVVRWDNERIVLNGWFQMEPIVFESELQVNLAQHSCIVKSNFKIDAGEFNVGTFIHYEKSLDNIIGGSVNVIMGEDKIQINLLGKIRMWHIEAENIVQFDKRDMNKAIKSKKFNHKLIISNTKNVVGSLKINGLSEGKNKFEVEVEMTSAKKRGTLTLRSIRNQQHEGNYQLVFNGKLNKQFVEISFNFDVKGKVFHVSNVINTSWGTYLKTNGELGQRWTAKDIHIDLQGTVQLRGKETPSQWMLKLLSTLEKTTSEFKLSRNNLEVIKYTADLQHPQDKLTVGKVILQATSILSIKVDFKIAKNGKGETIIILDMLKTEPKRKLELISNFHVHTAKFDVDCTATLDNDKKFHFKTENIVERTKFSTKNIFEIAEKKINFDASGFVKGEWRINGEIQGNFALKCPAGRIMDGTLKHKVITNLKTGLSQGSTDLQLNDQHSNGQRRSIVSNSKLDKGNFKTKEMSINSHFVFTNFEGMKLELVSNVKHLHKQHKKMIEYKIMSSGRLVSTPIDISLLVDDYTGKSATYSVSCIIGNNFSSHLNGNYNLGMHDNPISYELKGNLRIPQSQFKFFEVNSNGKFIKTELLDRITYTAEIHLDERSGNDQFLRFGTMWKGSDRRGDFSLNIDTHKMKDAFKIGVSYQCDNEDTQGYGLAYVKQKYGINFNYGARYLKSSADISFSRAGVVSMHYTLDSSFESTGGIDILIEGQKTGTGVFMFNMQATASENTYIIESKIFGSLQKKGLNLRATLAGGEPIVIVGICEMFGEKRIKVTLDVANLVDLDMKGNLEASYKTVADFYIVGEWSSIKLNLENYVLDIHSQEEAIMFNLNKAEGIVLAGSVTYIVKYEKNKSIVEGQGQLQFKGKNQNTNFKLICQHYDQGSDKEIGFSYTFNGNLGPKNSISTLKITNKEFNLKLSVCEEKKQCTNIQVQSIVATDNQNVNDLQHSLLVLIDLRELGYPHEFELQSKTIGQGFNIQYSLDSSIISNNNKKYQLVANLLSSSCKLQIKLPARVISFETKQNFPARGSIFGHYDTNAIFYFDKTHKPDDFTRITAAADLTRIEHVCFNSKGLIKFEHPTIRPLTISGKLEANRQKHVIDAEVVLDIFRIPEQQILVSSRIENARVSHRINVSANHLVHSSGLGFQYKSNGYIAINTEKKEISAGCYWHGSVADSGGSIYFFRNKDQMELQIQDMNEKLIQITSEFNHQKFSSMFETKIQLFGSKAIEVMSELHPSFIKFSLQREGVINASGEIKLGKEAKFNVIGGGNQLYKGRITFDAAKFPQYTIERDEDGVKSFLESVQVELKKDTNINCNKLRKRFQDMRDEIDQQINVAKESSPNFILLKTKYEENISEIAKELENDQSLKLIIDSYRKLYDAVFKASVNIASTVIESYEKLHELFVFLKAKLETTLKEIVLPAWEEISIHLTQIIGILRVEIINFHSKTFHSVFEIIKKYGAILSNFAKGIYDTLKPLYESGQEFYNLMAVAATEFVNDINKWIAKLLTFDVLIADFNKKLEDMKLVEKTLEFINYLFDQLHILPHSPESTEFLQRAQEYIRAKLKQENVHDEKLLEELSQLLVKTVSSFLTSLNVKNGEVNHLSAHKITSIYTAMSSIFTSLPTFYGSIIQLPALLSFRFSVFNLIFNTNWSNIFKMDFFNNWIYFHEFKLQGHVVDGRHFFTFDGQKLTFSGTCKYILAQDSHDNNFTVIAQLNNGKMKSIIITDRDGAFIEINDAGMLKFNGIPSEFPQHTTNMNAWRQFYTVWMRSEYGVQIMCTNDLKVCHVEVNGFYTSKTRGLLGNGNAELFDDFVKIDGTIALDYASFVNDYGLGKCNAVAYENLSKIERKDICNELFAHNSILALGYLNLKFAPYRSACDHAVSIASEKEKETAACTLALAYASALQMQDLYIPLPIRCLKCPGSPGQREIGQEFTVKTPNNKVDIVFLIDTGNSKSLIYNLITPVLRELRETLRSRGFTDIQIAVIAYNENQRYPALITSDNGKINYQGIFSNVHLDGPKTFCEHCVSEVVSDKNVIEVYEYVKRFIKSIMPQSDELAFRMALDFPFRASAAKSIVSVRSKAMDYDNMLKLMRGHMIGATSSLDGAILHLINPVKDLSLEGVPSEKLIGFNSRLIATLDGKDNKKRQKLQFHSDMGVDFVLNNGGWIFNTHNFENLKTEEKQKAVNQITSAIADTLFKTETVTECKCTSARGLHAQHKCAIKSSIFVANKKPKTT